MLSLRTDAKPANALLITGHACDWVSLLLDLSELALFALALSAAGSLYCWASLLLVCLLLGLRTYCCSCVYHVMRAAWYAFSLLLSLCSAFCCLFYFLLYLRASCVVLSLLAVGLACC